MCGLATRIGLGAIQKERGSPLRLCIARRPQGEESQPTPDSIKSRCNVVDPTAYRLNPFVE
jgi:hypothetical protein